MTTPQQAKLLAITVLVAGSGAFAVMSRDVPGLALPAGPWQPGSALDRRVFETVLISAQSGAEESTLAFRDGRFQSARRQLCCDFGWIARQTWTAGETIRFAVTARCPDAPLTVVRYGSIIGDVLQFEGTGTTRRWCWEQQIIVTGAGAAVPPPDGGISG